MDKLVEREPATRNSLVAAPALAVQFFLIPLAVVGITVSVYVGFRSLLADDRQPQDYLNEIRNGGSTRRWPAAYELSRLMGDPKVRADRTLAPALVRAFQESKDDAQVRRYMALAIGRLDPPLPPDAVADLTRALDDQDSETRISVIWALGDFTEENGATEVIPGSHLWGMEHPDTRDYKPLPAVMPAGSCLSIPAASCSPSRPALGCAA